mgnify:CR=1 FL=1
MPAPINASHGVPRSGMCGSSTPPIVPWLPSSNTTRTVPARRSAPMPAMRMPNWADAPGASPVYGGTGSAQHRPGRVWSQPTLTRFISLIVPCFHVSGVSNRSAPYCGNSMRTMRLFEWFVTVHLYKWCVSSAPPVMTTAASSADAGRTPPANAARMATDRTRPYQPDECILNSQRGIASSWTRLEPATFIGTPRAGRRASAHHHIRCRSIGNLPVRPNRHTARVPAARPART